MWQNTELITSRTLSVAAVLVATRTIVRFPRADWFSCSELYNRGVQRESFAREMSTS
jgi:hypothetical protein